MRDSAPPGRKKKPPCSGGFQSALLCARAVLRSRGARRRTRLSRRARFTGRANRRIFACWALTRSGLRRGARGSSALASAPARVRTTRREPYKSRGKQYRRQYFFHSLPLLNRVCGSGALANFRPRARKTFSAYPILDNGIIRIVSRNFPTGARISPQCPRIQTPL